MLQDNQPFQFETLNKKLNFLVKVKIFDANFASKYLTQRKTDCNQIFDREFRLSNLSFDLPTSPPTLVGEPKLKPEKVSPFSRISLAFFLGSVGFSVTIHILKK